MSENVSSNVIVMTVLAHTVPSPMSSQTEKPATPAVVVHVVLTLETGAPPHTPHAFATFDVAQVEVLPSAEQTFVPEQPSDATHDAPRSPSAGQQTPHSLSPPTSQPTPPWSCAEQATAKIANAGTNHDE